MQWLAPITGIVAAAVAIPTLVLMYFLKLKRREVPISSTLLWRRAVQDLQVNAPFQRLRRNILLLLQLLVLAAILVALARPVLSLVTGEGKRYVLLVDRSASMSATDEGTSRLETVKEQARTFIESLRGRTTFSLADASDQVMVVAFDDHAEIKCNFTSDKAQLLAAVDSIKPTHGRSSLLEASAIAQAFTTPPGEDANNRSAEAPAHVVLFSDGRIADLDQVLMPENGLTYHRVGRSRDNVAVVALQARRSYERPEQVAVFAKVANYGDSPVSCDVQLSVNGNVRAVRAVTIRPRREADGGKPSMAGEVSVTFALKHTGAGIVEVRHRHADVLSADDAAWAVLAPPKKQKVLLVTDGNPALRSALNACPLAGMDVVTPEAFDRMPHAEMTVAPPYDVIVLDRHVPETLPRCRYLVFGHPPPGFGVTAEPGVKNQRIVDWRTQHPLLQAIDLGTLFVAEGWKLSLPRDAEALAEFAESPALAVARRGGSVVVLVGFDVMASTWPFEPAFVMFCYNAMSFLATEAGPGRPEMLRVGQAITLEGLPAGQPVKVRGPGIAPRDMNSAAGTFRFAGTHRAGVYTVSVGGQAEVPFAVNLLDPHESDVEPVAKLTLAAQQVTAQQGPPRPANQEVWPWLAMLALMLVCVEWVFYNAKVRL